MVGRVQLDALVVCASELESRGFAEALRSGQSVRGHRFGLVIGQVRTLRVGVLTFDIAVRRVLNAAAAAVFTVHQPRLVVMAQLAIPLSPAVRPGQLFATREVVVETEAGLIRTPVGELTVSVEYHSPVLSVRDLPLRTTKRRELLRRTGAIAAAWRSHTIARAVCGHRGVDVAVFQPITAADNSLPPEALAVYGRGPGFRYGAAVGALLQGWDRLKVVRKLRQEAAMHMRELARGTLAIVERILAQAGD